MYDRKTVIEFEQTEYCTTSLPNPLAFPYSWRKNTGNENAQMMSIPLCGVIILKGEIIYK